MYQPNPPTAGFGAPQAQANRISMSSFIRDTLYTLPVKKASNTTYAPQEDAGSAPASMPHSSATVGRPPLNYMGLPGTNFGPAVPTAPTAHLHLHQPQPATDPSAPHRARDSGVAQTAVQQPSAPVRGMSAGPQTARTAPTTLATSSDAPANSLMTTSGAVPATARPPLPSSTNGPNVASALHNVGGGFYRGSSAGATHSSQPTVAAAATQGNPRHGRTGYGLDLTALLASLDSAPNSARTGASGPAGQSSRKASATSTRPQRVMSGRPRVPLATMAREESTENGAVVAGGGQTASTSQSSARGPPTAPLPAQIGGIDIDELLGALRQSQPERSHSDGRLTPTRALNLYEHGLSRYEKKEIFDFSEIFFLGCGCTKVDAPVANAPNFGFDDDRGDYLVTIGDQVAYRYEILSELGKGSFGQVLKVQDYRRNLPCALKVIRNKKRFHQQAQIEIRILEHLRNRDVDDRYCTVRMVDHFVFRSHVMIVFELHAMNLYELTKLNKYQPFPPALIKRFAAQLLVALSFMWRENIVHCDLKPENILLKQENKTGIKVIDFGSSCFETERLYTYIQSRFYRAPEIILGLSYGKPIDLWSTGCILCEMAIGYPVFPGENETEQLLCIMEVLGVPPLRLIERSPKRKQYFDSNNAPRLVPNSRNKVRRPSSKELQALLKTEDASFVDFILCFLRWEAQDRVTPNEAMRHPWIVECFQQEPANGGQPTAQPVPTVAPAPARPPTAGVVVGHDVAGAPAESSRSARATQPPSLQATGTAIVAPSGSVPHAPGTFLPPHPPIADRGPFNAGRTAGALPSLGGASIVAVRKPSAGQRPTARGSSAHVAHRQAQEVTQA